MTRRDLLAQSLASGLALKSESSLGSETADERPDAVLEWATMAAHEFRRFPDHERARLSGPDIVYSRVNNIDLRLDVITAGPVTESRPTLIYIHGGGWVHILKEDRILYLLPYLAHGMNTVNVEYRVANQSLAPAAVEDCRCALHWVYQHAPEYGIDLTKLVVAGESAGGHLALMTGMLDRSAGFDNACAFSVGQGPVAVAAIVNFFGITDVPDVLEGPHQMNWAAEWFGSLPDRAQLAKRVSPLTYVRPGLPPIITLHGTDDHAVPYEHGVRLHEALDQANVSNLLITVPAGGHGGWSRADNLRAQMAVFTFLRKQGILKARSDS